MGGTCRTNGKNQKSTYGIYVRKHARKRLLGKHLVAGSAVSWEKCVWGCRLDLSGSELGTITGFYENVNRGTVWVLDQLSVCFLVNKGCVSLSWYKPNTRADWDCILIERWVIEMRRKTVGCVGERERAQYNCSHRTNVIKVIKHDTWRRRGRVDV